MHIYLTQAQAEKIVRKHFLTKLGSAPSGEVRRFATKLRKLALWGRANPAFLPGAK